MPCRPSCSCRAFQRQHAEFTDGFLSVAKSRAMQEHLYGCTACATRDVWVRRSLLALQVLPSMEPSAGFRDRLYQRLGERPGERPAERRGASLDEGLTPPMVRLQLASSRGR